VNTHKSSVKHIPGERIVWSAGRFCGLRTTTSTLGIVV